MPPGPAPAQPVRRVIPAPTGANWALVVISLLLVLVAAAEIAYLLGFRPDSDIRVGPARSSARAGCWSSSGSWVCSVSAARGQRSRDRIQMVGENEAPDARQRLLIDRLEGHPGC